MPSHSILESDNFTTLNSNSYAEHPQYIKLNALLEHYKLSDKNPVIVKNCSFDKVSPELTLLTNRLIQHNFLKHDGSDEISSVIIALKKFQKAHGLSQTGALNKKTIDYLNRPLMPIINRIQKNLERWQTIKAFNADHVIVNIPAFCLYVFKNKKEAFSTPVVVGKPRKRTPQFNGKITSLITHPTWYIPSSLTSELANNVGSRGYAWESGRLVQRPGPYNPLGPIKFTVEGGGDILLHGTNKPKLFNQTRRAESLGCIRIKDLLPFAEYVLNEQKPITEIQEYIDEKQTRNIVLDKPMPVHVLYLTVWIDSENIPHFYSDVYGLDKEKHNDDDDDDDDDDADDF